MLAYSKSPPIAFKEAQKLYNETKPKTTVVSATTNGQPAPRASYAATAARDTGGANEAQRANGGVSQNHRQRTNSSYNAIGLTLDKSELESLVFAHMVTLRLVDSFIRNNYSTPSRVPLLESLHRAFDKVNNVLLWHQVNLQETNRFIIDQLQGAMLGLGLIDDNLSTETGSTAVAIDPSLISGVHRMPSQVSTPCEPCGSSAPSGPRRVTLP